MSHEAANINKDEYHSTSTAYQCLGQKSHLMEIVVIQPPLTNDPQGKKITEFKLNMSQFSIVDKVDLVKQTSELICSDLISTSVSK